MLVDNNQVEHYWNLLVAILSCLVAFPIVKSQEMYIEQPFSVVFWHFAPFYVILYASTKDLCALVVVLKSLAVFGMSFSDKMCVGVHLQ